MIVIIVMALMLLMGHDGPTSDGTKDMWTRLFPQFILGHCQFSRSLEIIPDSGHGRRQGEENDRVGDL